MSQALANGFDTLSRWFLMRADQIMQERTQMAQDERMQAQRLQQREQERKWKQEDWETEEAAKGEQRSIGTEIINGQEVKVDRSRTYNPQTKTYDEKTYGAMPVGQTGPKMRSGGGGAYLYSEQLGTDGKPIIVPTGYAGSKTGRAPKYLWVVRDGKRVRVADGDVREGDEPYEKPTKDSKESDKPLSWKEQMELAPTSASPPITNDKPTTLSASGRTVPDPEGPVTGQAFFPEPWKNGEPAAPGKPGQPSEKQAGPQEMDEPQMRNTLQASAAALQENGIPRSQWKAILAQAGFPPEAIDQMLAR